MEELAKAPTNGKKKSVIHRRKWLTLEEKLKIIEANERGKTSTKIAREQGMNESSVRSILRKKDFYKSLGTSTSFYRLKSFARHRSLLLDKVEEQLITWIEENNRKRIPLTEMEIQKKALALFNELNKTRECKEKFSASQGWFYRFKNRINMHNGIISGEKRSPDKNAAEKFRLEFAKTVQESGYTNHQVFNVEETSLEWKKMASDRFHLEAEKNQQRWKLYKDSLTLLLGSNAAGDLKLKPMVVYRSETPSALKDCGKDSLPVIWRSNKKAWLSKELFEDWFKNYFCPTVEKYCRDKGLKFKILLLLDSTPNHEISELNENVKVAFLPPNTAPLLQPLTLGVFPLLKAIYLREILSQALSSSASNAEKLQEFWTNYNIRKGIENIFKCWCDVTPDYLAGSWHQLLADVKIRDFESLVAGVAQDVAKIGHELGYKMKDVEGTQNPVELSLEDFDSPEFGEFLCKEEEIDISEDEYQGCHEEPTIEELEKIIQTINAGCELIAAADLDVERSIKIREALQNGIQPYKDLYDERTKEKCKYESNDL